MELSSSFSVLGNLLRLVRNESSCSPWSFSAPSSEDLAWILKQVDPTRFFMIFHPDHSCSWESRCWAGWIAVICARRNFHFWIQKFLFFTEIEKTQTRGSWWSLSVWTFYMIFFWEEKAIPKFGDLQLEERKSDQPGYWSLDHVNVPALPAQGIIHPSGSRLWFKVALVPVPVFYLIWHFWSEKWLQGIQLRSTWFL